MALLDPDRVDELMPVYRAHNNELCRGLSCFDGIVEMLAYLQDEGRRLGVVTAKPRSTVEIAFAAAGIADFFDVVVGSDATKRHKPHPEPILHALGLLGA